MIVDKLWKIVLSSVLATALIGGITYWATRETPKQMTPLAHELSVSATSEFARRIPRAQEVKTCLLIVSTRGPADQAQQLREMLVEAVDASGKYRLRTWSDVTKELGSNIFGQITSKLGLTPGEEPGSLQAAVSAAEFASTANVELDGILMVDSNLLEGSDDDGFGTKVTLEGTLWGLKAKKALAEPVKVHEEITSRLDGRYVSYVIGRQSLILRLFLWFLAAAGLPWLCITIVRVVVKKKDNVLNIGMLAVFTLLDLLLFWILVLAIGGGMGTGLALLLVGGLMGYYNYDACDYIERRLL